MTHAVAIGSTHSDATGCDAGPRLDTHRQSAEPSSTIVGAPTQGSMDAPYEFGTTTGSEPQTASKPRRRHRSGGLLSYSSRPALGGPSAWPTQVAVWRAKALTKAHFAALRLIDVTARGIFANQARLSVEQRWDEERDSPWYLSVRIFVGGHSIADLVDAEEAIEGLLISGHSEVEDDFVVSCRLAIR
jgi:hypothetical protein